ncbi:MAG: 2-hydroxyacyl-CoA dehydratase family protein [Candidatus Helarchaeota archaeon]
MTQSSDENYIPQYRPMINGILIENYLKLVMAFLSSKSQMQYFRKSGKKIGMISLPWGREFIFASKAVPIHFPRVGNFESHPILKALNLGKSFGWTNLMNVVRSLKYLTGDKFYIKLIYDFVHAIFWNYDRYIKIGEESGIFPLDSCFGTRMLYGNIVDNSANIDFNLGLGTRCNWFSKYFEIIEDFPKPGNKGKVPLLLLEIPNTFDDNGFNTLKENINQLLGNLEKITGNTITNNDLYKSAVISNSIKKYFKKLMIMWSGNNIKLPPLAYTNLFALLHIAFTDYLGDDKFFADTLKNLITELKSPYKQSYDVSNVPKIALINHFGGYEPELPYIIDELGGRLIIPDWHSLGLLEDTKTTGDMIDNFTQDILHVSFCWCNNLIMSKNWVDTVDKLNVDGVIFNATYGCKSLTPALKLFQDKLKELDRPIPATFINFQNIGDNLGQTKTRVGALIEMIK